MHTTIADAATTGQELERPDYIWTFEEWMEIVDCTQETLRELTEN